MASNPLKKENNPLRKERIPLRMEDLICQSIRNRKLLKINYKEEPERIVEPYVYGWDRYGLKLNAYQISGYSNSRKVPGWKLFKVELINQMLQLKQQFSVRNTYNPDYKIVTEVVCKV